MERLKDLWKRHGTVITATGVTLLIVAFVIVFAVSRSGKPQPGEQVNFVFGTYTPDPSVTRDPAATPTRPPEAVTYDLIGTWRQTGEHPSGILSLDLHGDYTAVYVIQGALDPEPKAVNTRWEAREGLFSLIVEGAEVLQFNLTRDGDKMTLQGAYGEAMTYERYTPATLTDLGE